MYHMCRTCTAQCMQLHVVTAAAQQLGCKDLKKAETRQVLELTQIYWKLETHSLSSALITCNSQLMQSVARLSE